MKKRILAVLIIICIAVLPLTACGEKYGRVDVDGKQDYTYAVISNGGSAVQYGNYVYFVNGYRGYEDEDAKSNVFGKVVKGALYRAELNGASVNAIYDSYYGQMTYKTFSASEISETGLEFTSTKVDIVDGYEKDEDGNYILDSDGNYIETSHEEDEINVQKIAPKTIGTSSYAKGGIYIYYDYVYYASPSNLKDKNGTVQVNKTVFFRTKLDGSVTQKIYSCKEDTQSSPYMFYKQNGKVYLTALDGTNIISVAMTSKKVGKKLIIAQDVTNAYFPNKSVYFEGIGTNGAEDFVYFTRAIDENDAVRSGNVIEIMRPDGSERIELIKSGNEATIMGVDNGYFFYKVAGDLGSEIRYTNLHNALTTIDAQTNEPFSPTYAANPQNVAEESGIALNIEGLDDLDEIYCFRPNAKSNAVFVLATSDNGITLYNNNNGTNIYSDSASIQKIDFQNNVVYFNSVSNLYRINLYDGSDLQQLSASYSLNAVINVDCFGDYAVYYAGLDEYAQDYAVVHKIGDEDSKFIGKKISDDIYDPATELEEEEEDEEFDDEEEIEE